MIYFINKKRNKVVVYNGNEAEVFDLLFAETTGDFAYAMAPRGGGIKEEKKKRKYKVRGGQENKSAAIRELIEKDLSPKEIFQKLQKGFQTISMGDIYTMRSKLKNTTSDSFTGKMGKENKEED